MHFENVAKEYSGLITFFARSYSLSESEIDDLFQEGLIALHKAFLTYKTDKGASFSTYASACIRNSMVSWVRANRPPKDIEIKDIDDEQLGLYSADDIEKQVLDKELYRRILADAEKLLSEKEYMVFSLVLRNMKNGEIAAALGVSVKSVENTLYRIKVKLKNRLEL